MIRVRAWENKSKRVHDIEPSSNSVALKETFDFINFFGDILGLTYRYDWTWKNNPRLWMTTFTFFFGWSQFFHTHLQYLINGEYKKILEVFPMYGAGISVIEFD